VLCFGKSDEGRLMTAADEAVSPHPEAADPVAMEVDQQAEPVPISQPLKLRFKLQGSGQL